jgi:hypothetical protein
MKSIVRMLMLSAVAVLFVVVVGAKAEIHDNSIGLRLSEGTLFGVELDYQKKVSEINRLELGASYNYDSRHSGTVYGGSYGISYIGAVGFYQWHWDIKDAKGLSWYVGPGAGLGFWTFSYDINILGYRDRYSDSEFYMNIAGEVGIEYDLNVSQTPILLSLDVRPIIGLVHYEDISFNVGLSVRYTF